MLNLISILGTNQTNPYGLLIFFGIAIVVLPIVITVSRAAWSSNFPDRYWAPDYSNLNATRAGSMHLGWTNYNGCLSFSAEEKGLYIKLVFLFKFFGKPVLIPWDQIRIDHPEGRIIKRRRIHLAYMRNTKCYIQNAVANYLEQQLRANDMNETADNVFQLEPLQEENPYRETEFENHN